MQLPRGGTPSGKLSGMERACTQATEFSGRLASVQVTWQSMTDVRLKSCKSCYSWDITAQALTNSPWATSHRCELTLMNSPCTAEQQECVSHYTLLCNWLPVIIFVVIANH